MTVNIGKGHIFGFLFWVNVLFSSCIVFTYKLLTYELKYTENVIKLLRLEQ